MKKAELFIRAHHYTVDLDYAPGQVPADYQRLFHLADLEDKYSNALDGEKESRYQRERLKRMKGRIDKLRHDLGARMIGGR